MSHSFLTFGWEPSAVVETERPSVCGSLLCGRYLLQGGKRRDRCEAFSHVVLQSVTLCGDKTEYITQHLTPTQHLNPTLDLTLKQCHTVL